MNRTIAVRKLNVDLSKGFARYWHGDDPYRTCLFNTFSMMFPAIEDHFSDVVKKFIPDLKALNAASLIAEAHAFIGQESSHRHLHAQYNAQLHRQGYSNLVERSLLWRIRLFRHASRMSKLSIVIGTEHFMAAFGDGLLRSDAWLEQVDEHMGKIWRWHAAEETEHKAVAFDIYQLMKGGYWRRVLLYAGLSIALLLDIGWQTTLSLAQDRMLLRPSTWWSAIRFWLLRPGVLWQVAPLWASFFLPRFHPWQHENSDLLDTWRTKYAADVRPVMADRSSCVTGESRPQL